MTQQEQGTYLERVAAYLSRAGLAAAGASTRELPGDASDRRYVRLTSPDGSSRVLLVHSGPIDADTLPFVNVSRLLRHMPVPTPAILDSAGDLGILALEDLGDVTLHSHLGCATADERRALYEEAVALIARMQQRGAALASGAYVPFSLAFDQEKLTWELEFFVEHFLIRHRGARIASPERAALGEEFAGLTRDLAAEPRVFCHRDYHSRNLMLHERRLYIIDFQDARMGPDTYDLVSLLRDSYVDHDPSFVAHMIGHYHELTGSSGGAGFLQRFDLMAAQRHLKALGTFGYQTAVAGSARYRGDIPRTLGYLGEVFGRCRRFDRLRTLLAAHVPELR